MNRFETMKRQMIPSPQVLEDLQEKIDARKPAPKAMQLRKIMPPAA